jgi:hypothetical protein
MWTRSCIGILWRTAMCANGGSGSHPRSRMAGWTFEAVLLKTGRFGRGLFINISSLELTYMANSGSPDAAVGHCTGSRIGET